MSLLVLSNTQEQYDEKDADDKDIRINTRTGIQKPEHFINRLTNAHIIPPNSRVAVQSCKIKRDNEFLVKDGTTFGLYLGRPLTDTTELSIDDSESAIFPVVLKGGYYSHSALAKEINNAINRNISHPAYYKGGSVVPKYNDTTGIWEGFDIKFSTQANNRLTSGLAEGWEAVGITDDDAIAVSSVVDTSTTLTRESADGSVQDGKFINRKFPLGHNRARCTIDLFNTTALGGGTWAGYDFPCEFSLVRPYTPSYFSPTDTINLSDIKISWDGTNLKLFTSGKVDDGFSEELTTHEIKYGYGSTFPQAITSSDFYVPVGEDGAGAGFIGKFDIEIYGEGVVIKIYEVDAGGTETGTTTIMDTTQTGSDLHHATDSIITPLCATKWYLCPEVGIEKEDHEVVFTAYDTYPKQLPLKQTIGFKENQGLLDWVKISQEVDLRDSQAVPPTQEEHYTQLATHNEAPAYEVAVVLTPEENPDTSIEGEYQSTFPNNNVDILLGFKNIPFVSSFDDVYATTTRRDLSTTQSPPSAGTIFTSLEAPKEQGGSLFIKCPSFTAKNLNYNKTLPTQILQHIPAFTDGDRASGNMWWEAKQLVYTRLQNSEPITMNDIEIILCDKNEKPVADLIGETIICLHIDREDAGSN